jgi:DNA repair photolyase
MEQDAVRALFDLPEEEGKKPYKHFMRVEPVRRDSEIRTDRKTGQRYEWREIGMLRNATKTRRMKVFLDPTPHVLVDDAKPLQGWYQSKLDPGHRPRPCMTEAVLTQPYGGTCEIRCGFCYINSGTRGYRSQAVTTVPKNYGAFVHDSLAKMRTSAAGYFCSFTEPFQRLEGIYHNTQAGATEFVRAGLPIFFLSRCAYPGWAIDLLKQNPYSYAQKSINTIDPEDWHKLSPGAIGLEDNFEEVRALHKAGIYISIQVNPIVAGVVSNEQIVALIHKLAACGADHLIFKFAEIAFPSRPALINVMTQQFGKERGGKFEQLFTCNIGHQATIDEQYRLDALQLFARECRKAGVTMATCYEYKFERDERGRIVSRTGVSVGRDFLTADQCHGHRVPMFTRPVLEGPFAEVEECPPSGCLHCGDESDGVGLCGSKFLASAKALEFPDYKKSVYGDERAPYTGSSPLVQISPRKLI